MKPFNKNKTEIKRLNLLSLKILIILNALIIIIPMFSGLLYVVYNLHETSASSTSVNTRIIQQSKSMRQALQKAGDLERKARLFILLSDPALRQPYELESYEAVRISFKQALSDLLKSSVDNNIGLLINELSEKEELIYQLIITADQNNPDLVVDGAFQGLRDSSNLLAREFDNYVDQQSKSLENKSESLASSLLAKGAFLLLISLTFSIALLVVVSRSIRQLLEVIQRMQAGNFEQAININGPSDLRELGDQLEQLRRHLKISVTCEQLSNGDITGEIGTELAPMSSTKPENHY